MKGSSKEEGKIIMARIWRFIEEVIMKKIEYYLFDVVVEFHRTPLWLHRDDDGGGMAGLSWDSSRRGRENGAWSGGDGGMAATSSGGGVMVTVTMAAMAAGGGMRQRGGV
ncbi:hypothetical protein Tco_0087048 [Tanacetum coccineum]